MACVELTKLQAIISIIFILLGCWRVFSWINLIPSGKEYAKSKGKVQK